MSEPAPELDPKLFESRSLSGSKKFRLHNTASEFPVAVGEALGVVGRQLMSHFPLSEDEKIFLLVLV
jgi:hypothetical protein